MSLLKRLALVGLLLAAAQVAATRKPLTIDTLWEWRTVSSPQISPDGKAVVYVLSWADKMNDAFYSNLWIVPVDGSGGRPVTQGAFRDTSPVWSAEQCRQGSTWSHDRRTRVSSGLRPTEKAPEEVSSSSR